MVRVDLVDLPGDVVDEAGVGVALLLQGVAAVAVLEAEDGLVAHVPHQHTGVALVGVDPLGELGEHLVLVRGVGEVVDAAAGAEAAAGLEPEAGDDAQAVVGGGVEEGLLLASVPQVRMVLTPIEATSGSFSAASAAGGPQVRPLTW